MSIEGIQLETRLSPKRREKEKQYCGVWFKPDTGNYTYIALNIYIWRQST